MNVIPCITWVKRGVAASVPEKVELTPTELEKIIKETQTELQDLEEDSDNENIERPQRPVQESHTDTLQNDEYSFEKYDEESGNIHCNIGNIATFGNSGKDPLVTGDDNDSEDEDDIIKADDNLVVVGHLENDVTILEVFVYNQAEGSFYCHHDMLLQSFPLCMEWLNYDPADPKPGNLCAIGTMSPVIEVWDLDLVNCLEPAYKLGCKPNKKKKQKRVGHKDAVLDLAWNENYAHVLASGSVDQTVLLWDLENGQPVNKFDAFQEKVQCIQWHPTETHHLLTGCADSYVRLFDCRHETISKTWTAKGEVERVLWNHFDSNYCIISTNNGYLQYMDIRNDNIVWEVEAHTKEITGLSLSSSCPGLLVSSSCDGVIKIWDIIDTSEPNCVHEKKTNLGSLQCLGSNPNCPFVFAMGGDNKAQNFKVFDVSEIPEVASRFRGRATSHKNASQKTKKEEEMMDVTEDMGSMALERTTSIVHEKQENKS